MKPLQVLTILSSSSVLLSHAWPLFPNHRPKVDRTLERRKPVSYSVVAVDGGSPTSTQNAPAAVPTTATITDAITTTRTITSTILSTTLVTDSETPTTVVYTLLTTTATTIINGPPTARPPPPPQSPTTPSPATVTVTELPSVQPVTKTYDDGMWHTNYYYTVYETSSSSSPSSSTMSASMSAPTTFIAPVAAASASSSTSTSFSADPSSTQSSSTAPATPTHALWTDLNWNSTWPFVNGTFLRGGQQGGGK